MIKIIFGWQEKELNFWLEKLGSKDKNDPLTYRRIRDAIAMAFYNKLDAKWAKEEKELALAKLGKLKASYLKKKRQVQQLSNENYRLKQRIAELQTEMDLADFEGQDHD